MKQAAGSQTKGVLSRCYQSTFHTRCENLSRLATLPGKGSGLFPPLAALYHLQERARERDAGRALAAPRPQRLETGPHLSSRHDGQGVRDLASFERPRFPLGPTALSHPALSSRKGREEAKGQTPTERILELGKERGWGGAPGTLRGPGSAGIDGSTAPACLNTLCLAVALRRPTSPGALLPVGAKRPPWPPTRT